MRKSQQVRNKKTGKIVSEHENLRLAIIAWGEVGMVTHEVGMDILHEGYRKYHVYILAKMQPAAYKKARSCCKTCGGSGRVGEPRAVNNYEKDYCPGCVS